MESGGGAEIISKVGVHVQLASFVVMIGSPKANRRMDGQAGKTLTSIHSSVCSTSP